MWRGKIQEKVQLSWWLLKRLQPTPRTLKSRVFVQSFHFIIKSMLLGLVGHILFVALYFKFTPLFCLATFNHRSSRAFQEQPF